MKVTLVPNESEVSEVVEPAARPLFLVSLSETGRYIRKFVPNAKSSTLQAIIRGSADIESVIHTDGWRGYDGLVDLGYEKHFRVKHGDNEFSSGNGNHINGIESFLGYAKHRLTKFKGVSKDMFELYLKETEFLFNHRGSA